MKFICSILAVLYTCLLSAQEKKSVEALFITAPLVIDGVIDEPVYSRSQPAKDFVQLQPYNGKPAFQPSEVHIFYDQSAIYVGAILYDSAPDSIFNFLSGRDDLGSSDYFSVYFDPYNQGQLAYGFFITPAGVQTDMKAIKREFDMEDVNWDAVWQSRTRITDKGWIVEMRIPYSNLRFPGNGGGTWGLQISRNIRRYNSNASWNLIDLKVSGFIHQSGQLTGIQNIKPPVRLSLSPFAAAYSEFKGKGLSRTSTYKGGMDLKYGISESFTLDMMLIPDFGQIQSDDKQLNLSPYELYYSEKRQFFTEGTELFERGSTSHSRRIGSGAQVNTFYSRRIGSSPKFSYKVNDELSDNEIVFYNPTETQLVNATKVSGRTPMGWGLGILNAMTLPSYATIRDTITGNKRKVQIQPFTNYNVAVVDKSLKNNSYISLINTNMMMANNNFSANVTATEFQIRNKAKTFAINGKGGISTRNDKESETGFFSIMGLEKNGGKLLFGLSQLIYSDKYNPNDMGYLRRNNELTTQSYLTYNVIEPFSIFREVHSSLSWNHIRMYRHNALFGNDFGSSTSAMFRNNWGAQMTFRLAGNKYDYYESRVDDRYFFEPYRFSYNLYAYSDGRKPIIAGIGLTGFRLPDMDQYANGFNVNINLRMGKRFQLFYATDVSNEINNHGFADMTQSHDTIYFARRDIKVIESVLGSSFLLNNKAGFDMRIRHYWSGVINKDYYQLQPDGSLAVDPSYIQVNNKNYNAFNIDLVFRWVFAPGSELTIAWKNSIFDNGDSVVENYWDNLGITWQANQTNSLSAKILYYFDYNNLRKKRLL